MNIRSSRNNPRELVRKAKKGKKSFLALKSNTAEGAKIAARIAQENKNSPELAKALIEETPPVDVQASTPIPS